MIPQFDEENFVKTHQPDHGELISKVISLLSISVMSILFGIKTYNVQYKYLSYSRWLILGLYLLSWAFTLTATIFVSTNNGNYLSCFLSEMACDLFYSGTKVVIYSWLIEKVWVVSASRQSRWKSKSYRFHVFLMTPYIAIFTLMIVFHIAELQADGVCIIGLQPIASISLLIYDFIFNLYMTILFVKPLLRNGGQAIRIDWKSSRLHDVAQRTLLASIVALLVSFANVLALAILNGRERGVLCLTCCTVDVTINVVTVHWVTTNRTSKISKEHATSTVNSGTNRNESVTLDAVTDQEFQPNENIKIHSQQEDNDNIYFKDTSNNENALHLHVTSSPSYNTLKDPNSSNYYNATMISKTHSNKVVDQFDEDLNSSRPSSIQESHSSRKSLTKK